jgi:mevalonate kinase
VNIHVKSELPIGAGLGSSASFSSCIATSLLLSAGHISINEISSIAVLERINKMSFIAEIVIHGTPSGIDNTLCTFGKLLLPN